MVQESGAENVDSLLARTSCSVFSFLPAALVPSPGRAGAYPALPTPRQSRRGLRVRVLVGQGTETLGCQGSTPD